CRSSEPGGDDFRGYRADRRVGCPAGRPRVGVPHHAIRSFPAITEVRRRVLETHLRLTHVIGYFAIPRRCNQGMSGSQRTWIDNLPWHHGCHMVDVAMWVLGATSVDPSAPYWGGQTPSMVWLWTCRSTSAWMEQLRSEEHAS